MFSQKVTDVRQAEKAAKDSVKKYHTFEKYQGGTEWYEVPKNKYQGFLLTIEAAIKRYRLVSNRKTFLQRVIAEMLEQE